MHMTLPIRTKFENCGFDGHWLRTVDGNEWNAYHLSFDWSTRQVRLTDYKGEVTTFALVEVECITPERVPFKRGDLVEWDDKGGTRRVGTFKGVSPTGQLYSVRQGGDRQNQHLLTERIRPRR